MKLTTEQQQKIKFLVNVVSIGIDFLQQSIGEMDESYEYGIRHTISEQVASVLSTMFNRDSIDTDTVGRYLKLYGVDKKELVTERISDEEIESRILNYVNSEEFKNP